MPIHFQHLQRGAASPESNIRTCARMCKDVQSNDNVPIETELAGLELAGGSTPERVVDLIHDVRGHDNAVVETATVKTLKSFLTTRD